MIWRSAANFTAQEPAQVGSPLLDGLPWPAVNEVEADVFETRSPRCRDRFGDLMGLMQPAQCSQPAPIERLCADAKAIHSRIEQPRAVPLVEIVGIGFDRDFRARGQREGGLAGGQDGPDLDMVPGAMGYHRR